jgi:hypothetical protein
MGTNRSYVLYEGQLGPEDARRRHFEGMLMWNGIHKYLDMLIALDLQNGLAQETGTMPITSDGVVVRDTVATYSPGVAPHGQALAGDSGVHARFRQTYRSLGPDKVLTQVLRQQGDDWVATFPGSDHLVMNRRVQHL